MVSSRSDDDGPELDRLRRRLALHETFLEEIRELVSVLRPDGSLAYVSPSLRKILGFEAREKAGADALGEVHPDDRPRVEAAFRQILEEGGSRHLRYRVAHQGGGWRVLDTVAKNRLDDPVVDGVLVTSWDVSELQRVQDALEARAGELEERVKEMDCLLQVSRWLGDDAADWDEILHRVAAAVPGGFQDPGSTSAVLRLGGRRYESPSFRDGELSLCFPIRIGRETAGEIRVSWSGPPPAGDDPFLAEERRLLVAIAQRIGEAAWRRQATERLHQREAYYRVLARRAGVLIGVTDEHGRVRDVGEEARSLLGYSPEELKGMSTVDLVAPADRPRVEALLAAALERPAETLEGQFHVALPDGGERVVDVTVRNLLADAAVGGLVVTARDVTERVRQEQKIQMQADLLDAVGQAVIATDAAGDISYWNRAAEALYGWSRDEVLGRPILEITPSQTDAPDAPDAEEILEGLLRGEPWSGEIELQRQDKTRFPAFVTNTLVHDGTGAVVGIIGVSSDLTERKTLEEHLRRAQRLEAIGQLAGGVAHDFNNILTVIGGYCALAAQGLPAGSAADRHLQQALEGVQRASRLTSQLLAFSRRQYVDEQLFDLREALHAVEPMLRRLIPERIELHFEAGSAPCRVLADPGQIERVIVNLAVNARDAIAAEGRISLQVDRRSLTENEAAELPWRAEAGEFARLVVEDTGEGIPEEIQDHIFEPFFSTKPVGQGTGLGLSMIYGTVKRAGGHVLVDGRPGRGARFEVLLPAVPPAEADPAAMPADPHPAADEPVEPRTLLLVEDDPSVLALSRHVLEAQGHTVLHAANGIEALEVMASREVDLIVADVVMPEMGGVQLMDRLHETHPGLHVILMSGYPSEELPMADHRAAAFLHKPFTPRELADLVRRVLRGEPPPHPTA